MFKKILLMTAFIFPSYGFAIPITYTLTGVVFPDGGSAAGTFTYDADEGPNGTFSNINITLQEKNGASPILLTSIIQGPSFSSNGYFIPSSVVAGTTLGLTGC